MFDLYDFCSLQIRWDEFFVCFYRIPGYYGIPLLIFVLSIQIYTAVVLGRCWIIAEKLDPRIIDKKRWDSLSAIPKFSFIYLCFSSIPWSKWQMSICCSGWARVRQAYAHFCGIHVEHSNLWCRNTKHFSWYAFDAQFQSFCFSNYCDCKFVLRWLTSARHFCLI